MNQMELNQIFVFYKVEAFYPFISATLSDVIIFKTIFMKAMNQKELNQIFVYYKVVAFYPFITATLSDIIIFKTIL
jgi:hypothetical protein